MAEVYDGLYLDEALAIVERMIAQAVRDYTNPHLRFSNFEKERIYHTSARDFLNRAISIEWGKVHQDIADLTSHFGTDYKTVLLKARMQMRANTRSFWMQQTAENINYRIVDNPPPAIRIRPAKKVVYLSGPIEQDKDNGHGWIEAATDALAPLKFKVVSPHDIVKVSCEELLTLKNNMPSDYRRVLRDEVFDPCIAAVQHSNIVVAFYSSHIPTSGTHGECTMARACGIPVYIVCPDHPIDLPGWLYACSLECFGTFPGLAAYLQAQTGVN